MILDIESKHFWRNNTLRPRYATKLAKYLAVSMPRAFSGCLPFFERSSVELGPSNDLPMKRELENLRVFHLFAAAALSRLRSLVGNLSFTCCFYVCLHSTLIFDRIQMLESLLQALPPFFAPAARAPWESLLAGYVVYDCGHS